MNFKVFGGGTRPFCGLCGCFMVLDGNRRRGRLGEAARNEVLENQLEHRDGNEVIHGSHEIDG
jgi:hypothetical protein